MTEKDLILKHAKVLLISNHKEDYKSLKNYGFVRISHFNSVIEASKHFENHLESLNGYNIIFERCQKRQLGSFSEQNQMYYLLWEMNRENCLRINFSIENGLKTNSIYLMNGKKYTDVDHTFIFEEAIQYLQVKKDWIQNLIEQEIKSRTRKNKVNPDDEIMLDFIKKYDQLLSILKDYTLYSTNEYTKYSSDKLQIEKSENGFLVKNYDSGKLKGALVLSEEKRTDLRILQILNATKKGNLKKPLMVGIYTSVYDNLKGIPLKIGEKEKYLFHFIWIKAVNRLMPAISYPKKEIEMDTEAKVQNRKRRIKE